MCNASEFFASQVENPEWNISNLMKAEGFILPNNRSHNCGIIQLFIVIMAVDLGCQKLLSGLRR